MAQRRKAPSQKAPRSKSKTAATRPKLDPRLAFLLSLPAAKRDQLAAEEADRTARLAKDIAEATTARAGLPDEERSGADDQLRALDSRLFAPLTHGLVVPSKSSRKRSGPQRIAAPYVSAFILSDASAADLKRLGVQVRSQAGDVFSAFIPLDAIARLEASPAIRFVELSRPLFPTLDVCVPTAQIDTLHGTVPPVDGAGVIVGIFDSVLDIYHPDFRTAADTTRVLFLWDQTLSPRGGEAGPPVAPALPGFTPAGGVTYGVEYNQATINAELASFNPPTTPAYRTVRHGGTVGEHGTHVAGIAVGNGRAQAGAFVGAAPAADIIFVASPDLHNERPFSDSSNMADAFAYIFARAAQLGKPCVINMSNSDNQGPHDGTTLAEQFLDNLLLAPGRAITLSAGNSNTFASHATGTVAAGGTTSLVLNYRTADINNDGVNDLPTKSDAMEIWYDGHDRFDVTVRLPTVPATTVGPIAPGSTGNAALPNGVQVHVISDQDARNGDNLISIILTVPVGQSIPLGDTTIALAGTTVINGTFHAWIDRNNRGLSRFMPPHRRENQITLGVPATMRRAITVGNHMKAAPPVIATTSGCGPTRDGRIKPELAAVGSDVMAPSSSNKNAAGAPTRYVRKTGTSMSAPLVGGVCALLFQCRGASATWANLKQILEDTALPAGATTPGNAFGFGAMRVSTACSAPAPSVDIWLRDEAADTGAEPFTGPVAWISPDIEVLDSAGNPVANPTHDPTQRFNNIIRVTVRNRGTNTARNTEVYLYWADPATNLPFPSAWNTTGILTGAPGFSNQSNKIVIAQLAAGASSRVDFGWAPPASGSNIRGDDHFCLLVRLENESDPSQIGVGGWSTIAARNNIAMKNVHVQPDDGGDSIMGFQVIGSSDQDGLMIYQELAGGSVDLVLPAQALPWRDIRLIERHGRRAPFGHARARDPLAARTDVLSGEQIRTITDMIGAERLMLRDGIATVTIAPAGPLHLPRVELADGARMPARIVVRRPKTDGQRRFVHVAQYSGGQLVGGVSLELRLGLEREPPVER